MVADIALLVFCFLLLALVLLNIYATSKMAHSLYAHEQMLRVHQVVLATILKSSSGPAKEEVIRAFDEVGAEYLSANGRRSNERADSPTA